MAAPRTSSWIHQDGDDASCAALTEIVSKHATILQKGPDVYTSDDLRIGIDTTKLQEAHDLMLEFVQLDTRGRTSPSTT